jgi:hypothetical protein
VKLPLRPGTRSFLLANKLNRSCFVCLYVVATQESSVCIGTK